MPPGLEVLREVVVVAEEAVEAVLRGERLAVDGDVPPAELAAEVTGALDQGDVELALRELDGRDEPREAPAHDHHAL